MKENKYFKSGPNKPIDLYLYILYSNLKNKIQIMVFLYKTYCFEISLENHQMQLIMLLSSVHY